MAYGLIQSSTISGFTNVAIQLGRLRKVNNAVITTNSASGTATEMTSGRYHYEVELMGYFNTGSGYPLPVGVTLSNGPVASIQRVSVVRRQFLRNVTNAGTANGQADFTKGVQTYVGQGMGALANDETPLEDGTTALTTFTLPISSSYSLAGNAIIRTDEQRYEFDKGGNIVYPFSFAYTGAVTTAGTNNPFSLTEISLSGTLDTGQTVSGTVLIEQIQASINYEAGSAVPFMLSGPFSGAVTFAAQA